MKDSTAIIHGIISLVVTKIARDCLSGLSRLEVTWHWKVPFFYRKLCSNTRGL